MKETAVDTLKGPPCEQQR